MEAHRDPTYFSRRRKKPPTTQPNASQLSFAEAKRRKENYLAELRRVELEEKTGKLIERAEVERQAFETGRRVRDYLLNIPNRVAGEVAAALGVPPAEGQEQVYHILNREIQQALEQLK